MRFAMHETDAVLQDQAAGPDPFPEGRPHGEHLACCKRCRDLVGEYRVLHSAVRADRDSRLVAATAPPGLLERALADAMRSDRSVHSQPQVLRKETAMKQGVSPISMGVRSQASVRQVRTWSGATAIAIALSLGGAAGFWASQRQIDAGLGPESTPISQAPDTKGPNRTARQAENVSLLNLRKLSIALNDYAEDWSETLPPMESAAIVRKALLPYLLKTPSAFIQPDTGRPYAANPYLSHRRVKKLQDPHDLITFYEAIPRFEATGGLNSIRHQYGSPIETESSTSYRFAAFVEGNPRLVTGRDWNRIKHISHLP